MNGLFAAVSGPMCLMICGIWEHGFNAFSINSWDFHGFGRSGGILGRSMNKGPKNFRAAVTPSIQFGVMSEPLLGTQDFVFGRERVLGGSRFGGLFGNRFGTKKSMKRRPKRQEEEKCTGEAKMWFG